MFADPPFNLGKKYDGFKDRMMPDKYGEFTLSWMKEVWRALSPAGVMCLHGNDNLTELYLSCAEKLHFRHRRIAWVIWHYRFGQNSRRNWVDSHCHCLIYAVDPGEYTWNPDDVLVESDRVRYGDRRARPECDEYEGGGRRLPLTVFGVPSDGPGFGRVQGTNSERVKDRPNQLPERYLERLIRAYTNEGDRILDPFAGAGTTAVVAKALKRDCVTIDVSDSACRTVRTRLRRGAVRI